MDRAAIERITNTVLAALASDEPVNPLALTFLLRRYRETDRADLRDALEPALARALDRSASVQSIRERAAWLQLLAEAAVPLKKR